MSPQCEGLWLVLICKSPWYFLLSFKSISLSFPEKKFKIDFQEDYYGSHHRFPIGTYLDIFDLQVSPILPCFESNGLSVQEKKLKIDFQDGHHGGHLWFLIRTILAFFYLQLAVILPTMFRVNSPFCSREDAQNIFFFIFSSGGHLVHWSGTAWWTTDTDRSQ